LNQYRSHVAGRQISVRNALTLLVFVISSSVFAQIPSGYYDPADGLTGQDLATALHDIIDDHLRYPYTASTTDVWDIVADADEDPGNTANVITIYKNESKPELDHSSGSGWNREHSWPKSLGFPDDGACNYAYTDVHHLFAADWSYNSARSNKPFDNCDSGCTEWDALASASSNWTAGSYAAGSWEPWDGVKGDLARAMFYMAVRYNGGTHGITGCSEPDLQLTDNRSLIANTSGSPAYMGVLSVLVQWHLDDPVDASEQARNNVVYSYQGNRNPFVDHPEWVVAIFGSGNGSGGQGNGNNGGGNNGGGSGGNGVVWINEIHYDNASTDAGEGVEIAGPAGTDTTGWQLIAYNGNGGTSYATVNLSGTLTDQANGFGTAWYAISGLQNGAPDGIALVDPQGSVVEFLSWEGSFTASNGAASGLTATDIGVAESGTTPLGHSLQLGGTGNEGADFAWQTELANTAGTPNTNQTFTSATTGGGTGVAGGTGTIWINEIHYDNASTDAGEGIEIAGPSGTDTSGWQLIAYNGNGGASYATVTLSGTLTDQDNGFGTAWYPITGLQNGAPDGVALVDPQGSVIEFISWEGTFTAIGGAANGLTSADIGVSEDGNTPLGDSLQLSGTGSVGSDFTWQPAQANTTGAINAGQTFVATSGGTGSLWVNEIHYDNDGADSGEGIEVAGPAGADTSGWQLVAYNGSGGASYDSVTLSGTLADQADGFGTLWFPISGLQNGAPDGVALIDPQGTVVAFLSWEGSFTATNGPALGLSSSDIGVSEGSSTPVGHSLQLGGSGSEAADFSWQAAQAGTPGQPNVNQSFTGAGSTSWSTILTADFESGLGGFSDGGSDVRRSINDSAYAWQGDYCVRLRDNSGTDSALIQTDAVDFGTYGELKIAFTFIANSMESGEDFLLEVFDGSQWQVVAAFVSGTDFDNGQFYTAEVTLDTTDVAFASNGKIRFRCDASGNNDQIYLDQVTLSGR